MIEYFAEFIGTSILILLGNGVVANVNLKQTLGERSGWIVITAGWGMAVFVAVLVVGPYSGAHINPAVTIGVALAGLFEWSKVPGFILAQILGAMMGGFFVYAFYRDHFDATDNAGAKKACFCTAPGLRNIPRNFLCELIGTFVLIASVLFMSLREVQIEGLENVKVGLGSLEALPVGLVVFAIGMSLGGTTGYAINPARDLGPRIMHALLPIKGKQGSDWPYSWVPVLGPFAGAGIAALLYFFMRWLAA
jgi:glycerol uptake facilitator protein